MPVVKKNLTLICCVVAAWINGLARREKAMSMTQHCFDLLLFAKTVSNLGFDNNMKAPVRAATDLSYWLGAKAREGREKSEKIKQNQYFAPTAIKVAKLLSRVQLHILCSKSIAVSPLRMYMHMCATNERTNWNLFKFDSLFLDAFWQSSQRGQKKNYMTPLSLSQASKDRL